MYAHPGDGARGRQRPRRARRGHGGARGRSRSSRSRSNSSSSSSSSSRSSKIILVVLIPEVPLACGDLGAAAEEVGPGSEKRGGGNLFLPSIGTDCLS